MNHVRIIRFRPNRRINGSKGQTETLCGGEMTALDLSVTDAKADMKAGWNFLTCEKCKAMMEGKR